MTEKPKPLVLLILDGWGIVPPTRGNAITIANIPNIDELITTYPSMTLQSSGDLVGLSWGEMGNSEVGHLCLGGGKIIYQNLPRITLSIRDGSFFKNKAFREAVAHVKKNNSKLHLLGLVSPGGVHSLHEHLYALLEFCKKEKLSQVFIQAILDGRDTPHNSAQNFIAQLQNRIKEYQVGQIATLSGRYYAMDRDNHWDRIEKAYRAMVEGESSQKFEDPLEAIKVSYKNNIFDEEFIPTVITKGGKPVGQIGNNDAIIFFNFRADRARELTKVLVVRGFEKFKKSRELENLYFVTMTEYEKSLPVKIAFPTEKITQPLAKVLADQGLKQLHIAETEKYAHVTYFFNGGEEKTFKDEERILIPSPSVSSYDQKPEMSAEEIKDRLIKEIKSGKYDFIVANFANADMVGHTGKLEAVIQAIETIDKCVGELVKTILEVEGVLIITSDHGNAEEMLNLQTGVINKEHTINPIPFILVGKDWEGKTFKKGPVSKDLSTTLPGGILADVAPTILDILKIKKPPEMTGRSLIK